MQISTATRSCASAVEAARCGVKSTRSSARSGESAGSGSTENTSLQARRPIQGFQEIQAAFAGGKGDYHALQVKVERRYTRGLYLLNSFTWSRARDNASGHLEVQNGDNSRVNYRDLEAEHEP